MAESDLSNEVNGVTVLPAASGVSASSIDGDVAVSWTNNDDSPDGGIDVERLRGCEVLASSIHGKDIVVQEDGYGTWVCLQNYEHYGGTNPSVAPVDTFPQLTNGLTTASDIESAGANGELCHVDDIDQYGGWDVDAVRLEATTTNHNRKIHFFTTNQTVIDATFTEQSDETDYTDYQGTTTTLYDDHTANLPEAAGNGDADTRSDRIFGAGFPFYQGGNYHWALGGNGNRWEVDDYPDSAAHSTVHRVWVRVTGTTETEILNNTQTTITSGLSPSTTSYTDTSVSEGTTYEYRIERNTDHATATSGVDSVTTPYYRVATMSGDGAITPTRQTTAARTVTHSGDGKLATTRTKVLSRTPTVRADSTVTASGGTTKPRTSTVTADTSVAVTRAIQRTRIAVVQSDGAVDGTRSLVKDRASTLTADGTLTASQDGYVKTRTGTVTGDGRLTNERATTKTRAATTTGDAVVTITRQTAKPRTATMVGAGGVVNARGEFQEVFPDEQTNNLTWDFSFDEPFGFVSEWITETDDLGRTDAFTVVVDSNIVNTYELGVEYDIDGDGEAEHRTETQTVKRDGQTLVFPTIGEPGQYRLYIQQMRVGDYLRELTVGLTRY